MQVISPKITPIILPTKQLPQLFQIYLVGFTPPQKPKSSARTTLPAPPKIFLKNTPEISCLELFLFCNFLIVNQPANNSEGTGARTEALTALANAKEVMKYSPTISNPTISFSPKGESP